MKLRLILTSSLPLIENSAPSTVVGLISAVDLDVNDVLSFSLVAGDGDDDNALFRCRMINF